MPSFGAKLKHERESRKITLEEVARSTKISKRHLLELEEERFKDLPGGIFNKGFVRAYAKQLELDEEEMVREYVAAEAEVLGAPVVPPVAMETTKLMSSMAVAKEHQESVRRGDPVRRFMTIAVIAVVLLGVGGFVYRYFDDQKSSSTARAAAPEHRPRPVSAVPVAESGEAQATLPQGVKAVAPVKAAPQPLFVELHAKETSWILVNADGKETELTLAANETRSFTAEKELTMKLGNAEAVEIRRNGNRLPDFPPGTKTHTISFTPDI